MLQFISVDSRHFTQSELSLGWSDLHETPSVNEKDHGHLRVECALHSLDDQKISPTLKGGLKIKFL